MQTETAASGGSPRILEHAGHQTRSGFSAIDDALKALDGKRRAWVATDLDARIALLDQVIADTVDVADAWAEAGIVAKRLPRGTPIEAEEYLMGPWPTIRCARLYRETLNELQKRGAVSPGKLRTHSNGQVVANVFPQTLVDRAVYDRVSIDIWMQPGVSEKEVADTMAPGYRDRHEAGDIGLVLGAGNVAAISSTDILHKLFVDNEVVVLKMNPVNDYAGPFIEQAFRSLVDGGWLRVVYGGVEVGAYLCEHDLVTTMHMTGSDKTFNAIVFGTGADGERRRMAAEPSNSKPFSCELGNVSPVIVVPGPWKPKALAATGESLASQLTANVGFNCVTSRVILNHAAWDARDSLLDGVREALRAATPRYPYYPGTRDRYLQFVEKHPEAQRFGPDDEDHVPFTLIPGVDPEAHDDIVFNTEAFAPLFAETMLEAPSVVEYIRKAVTYCNERIWGSLAAQIIVHPASMKDPEVAAAVEQAIADLRYGTVAVNTWAGQSFLLMNGHWGAFPGHAISDIRSGQGWVHNTRMFARPQKTVIRGPFNPMTKPAWYSSHGTVGAMGPLLVKFEASQSLGALLPLTWQAVRG